MYSMISTTLFCAILALVDGVLAINLSAPTGLTKPRSFAFEKVKKNVNNIPKLRKRADTVLQHLDNMVSFLTKAIIFILLFSAYLIYGALKDFLYYANISIGTPPQQLRLQYALIPFFYCGVVIINFCAIIVLIPAPPIYGLKVRPLLYACSQRTLARALARLIITTLRPTCRLELISAFHMSMGSSRKVITARIFFISQMA